MDNSVLIMRKDRKDIRNAVWFQEEKETAGGKIEEVITIV